MEFITDYHDNINSFVHQDFKIHRLQGRFDPLSRSTRQLHQKEARELDVERVPVEVKM